MQETNFPIEIIIHDDASTDKTQQIVKQYVEKFPELIIPIFQTENQFSKGNISILGLFIFPIASGKYIAICEGDDFWTDPLKLQKQVDFLERNPDCSVCFHAAKHFNEKESDKSYIHRPKKIPVDNIFHVKDVILGGGGFMTTNSIVFITEYIRKLPNWYFKTPVEDLPLMLILASKGAVGYLNEIMSVYRIMAEGSWSSRMKFSKQKRQNHHKAILRMFNEFNKATQFKYSFYVFLKKSKNILKYILHGHC